MKLHTGALGTLGILTQVTLKVKPHPETSRFVLFGLNGSALGPTLDRLHESPARPAALELLNDAACRSLMTRLGYPMLTAEPWWLLCGFEEKESTVGWQVQTLQDDLRTAPVRNLSVMTAAESLQIWQGLADGQNPSGSLSALQVSVRPSQVALLAERANALRSDLLIQAHAGNGIVRIHADNDVSLEEFSRIHQSLLAGLPREGRIVVLRCPAPWKKHLAIWGPKTSSSPLRAEIKRTLDPDNLFNPGRL
jgi:glycolate oxidase FAD binding subunit